MGIMIREIIRTNIDVTNTENALKYLKSYYKNVEIEFLGWNNGKKVVCIDGINYFLSSMLDKILLKETNTRKIEVLETKIDEFKKYNEILK